MRTQTQYMTRNTVVRDKLRARQARRAHDEMFEPEPAETPPARQASRPWLTRPWLPGFGRLRQGD